MCRSIVLTVLGFVLFSGAQAGNIVAQHEPHLAGSVFDLRGHAVAGAKVVVSSAPALSDDGLTTETDGSGEFSFQELPAARYQVSITRSGFIPVAISSVEVRGDTTRRVNVRMIPALTIHGRVSSSNDRPVSDAEVRFVTVMLDDTGMPAECQRQIDAEPAAKTNSAGGFVLEGLAVCQDAVLKVLHPEFPPHVQVLRQDLSSLPVVHVGIELLPGGTLSGRVLDLRRLPIGGASVELVNLREGPAVEPEQLQATTGGDGSFAVARIPPGVYRARIDAENRIPEIRDGLSIESGSSVELGDVRMAPGTTIGGRVVTPSGDGARGTTVTAYRRYSDVRRRAGSTTTNSAGMFRLTSLQPGLYDLRAVSTSTEGGSTELRDVEAPSEDVDLVLEPSGSLEGTVVRGDPVAADRVEVAAHLVAWGGLGAPEGVVTINQSTGEFTIRGLDANEYVVVARARGFGPAKSSVSRVTPGRVSSVGDLVLARGLTLQGRVLDTSSGSPVGGATITCEVNGEIAGSPGTFTDPNGEFQIDGLLPGAVQLAVRHPGYAPERFHLEIKEEIRESAELRLSRGAMVHGIVREASGKTVANVAIEAGPHGGPWVRAWSDEAGSYRLEHLKEGRIYLRRLSGLGAFEEVDGRELELAVGEIRREDFVLGSTVFGQVRRNGGPIPFARVSMSQPTADGGRLTSTSVASASAWADSEGMYRIASVPTGNVLIAVEDGDRLITQRSEVPEISPFRLDIDLPGQPISGVVLDGETGSPLAGAFLRAVRSGGNDLMIMTSSSPLAGGEVVVAGSAEITQASSQPDGTFTLWVSEPGTYQLTVEAADYTPRQVTTTTTERVEVELRKGGSIGGRVVGPQAGGQDLSIACLMRGRSHSCKGSQGAAFRFEGVDPGSYGIVVAINNKGLASGGNVDIKAGENEPLDLTLQPAPEIVLAVGSAKGSPHFVSLLDSTGADLLPILRMASLAPVPVSASPDNESRYVVRGLPAGTYAAEIQSDSQRRMIAFTAGGTDQPN